MNSLVLDERRGRVAVVTLNRPDNMNALNTDLMAALVHLIRSLAEDDDIGCVVLTGAGRAFCAGGDLKAITQAAEDKVTGKADSARSSVERRTRWLRRSVEASRLLHEMPKPTIAMINGACAGAGLSLAAACDFRFAAAGAKFAPAFVAHGLSGDYGGTWLWSQILGTAKARQLYMLDEKRDATAALEFGLVDRVLSAETLREETLAVADRLAGYPATGLAYMKANLNGALTDSFTEALDRESLNMMLARNALIEARKAAV
ncbi:MAG: enoyl-CoA hydratase/isomerase [Bradyrhizobium sp.]|nr:enoyl-CoA hydratase/isomerase [Bradyrhizobium sp.]